ncbi:MAG: glycosyltransferase family 4 protein [Thermoanaerobaculia bacterium]|nr:glycosyltransferase family 4 protein [Thermoanaerobaculia bacterium]
MARRILMVVNHAGFFLTHRLPLAVAARERGYEVHVATPQSKHVPAIEGNSLGWHPVRLTRSGTNPFAELRAVSDLVSLYRKLRPELVHHVTTKPVLYGTAAARIARVPAVVNALAGLGHLSLADDLFHRVLRGGVRLGFKAVLRHRNMRVIFQNEDDRAAFVDRGILAPRETVLVPGSGVDPELFRPVSRPRGNPPVVVLPSRMLYTKGVAEFVGAARILKAEGVAARFVLVGEPDPDNPASIPAWQLSRWASEGAVEWQQRRDDMPAVYAESDVVVLPSYREGMPKVLIEAGACGLPAVTTDVPGCRDVVEHERSGLLVPVRDRGRELAKAIARLLRDEELSRSMGRRGRELVLERFALPRIIDQTISLYAELMR